MRIARLYTSGIAKELAKLKIDRYFDILLTLSAQSSPVTQKTLAGLLHIDKSRMVSILDYLGDKGYVFYEVNPADRREHLVSLSAEGKKIIPQIKKAIAKNSHLLTNGIAESAFDDCMKTLAAIEHNLLIASQL